MNENEKPFSYVNTSAYTIIKESGLDPERHILPICHQFIKAGSIVGLYPSDGNNPEIAHPIDVEEDFWIFERFGIVNEDTKALSEVKVFAARKEATSGAEKMIYVKLRSGTYIDLDKLRSDVDRMVQALVIPADAYE